MAEKFQKLHETFQGQAYSAMLEDLGKRLGVSANSLVRLGFGWAGVVPFAKTTSYSGWWTIPERNTHGEITGLSLRNLKGNKVSYPGSKHGLFYEVNPKHRKGEHGYSAGPHNWRRTQDEGVLCPVCKKPDGCLVSAENPSDPKAACCFRIPSDRKLKWGWLHILKPEGDLSSASTLADNGNPAIIVEGATDTATALDLGFDAVGRPSNLAGNDLLRDLIRGRKVWVIGENDKKADGSWPGREGLLKVLETIGGVCDARGVFPPEHVKDLRAWKISFGLTREKLEEHVKSTAITAMDIVAERATEIIRWIPALRSRAADLVRDTTRNTGMGNAARFIFHHGQVYRHCPEMDKDMRFDGARWIMQRPQEALDLAGDTVRRMREQAKGEEEMEWAEKSEDAYRMKEMIQLASPLLSIPRKKLDADPFLLCTPAGIIDLQTGELREAKPEDFCTKITACGPDPDLPTPLWDTFLGEIFLGDTDLIHYMQKFMGYCLSGDIREQFIHIAEGRGQDGKSVFFDTISEIMGDYASGADEGLLACMPGAEHPTVTTVMSEARLVTASETDRDARMRTQRMKRLTGDSKNTSRKMRQDFETKDRTAKLVLITNNQMVISEMTKAVWRRVRRIPFLAQVDDAKVDRSLRLKLRAEWPGILAWLVRGFLFWQTEGLNIVPAIREYTEEYRKDQDVLGQFVDEYLDKQDGVNGSSSGIYHAYCHFSKENGQIAMGIKKFSESMQQRGYVRIKSTTTRLMVWKNLTLNDSHRAFGTR
jgi:putative DNA primase/helicase